MTLIPLHVIAGAIAIVSGFVALYALKGARLHRKSGTIFVYAMLVMSLSGAVMAVGRAGAAMNIPAGLVTAYLVDHLAPHRSASVRGIAPGGARRDAGGVRARPGEHRLGVRQRRQGKHRLRLSALDVRRPRPVGRRGRSPDDPGRRTPGSA